MIAVAALLSAPAPVAAQEAIQIPTDQSYSISAANLPNDCAGADLLHLRIADQPLVVPRDEVTQLTPVRPRVTGRVDDPAIYLELPPAAGCSIAPLEAGVVEVHPRNLAFPFGIVLADLQAGPFEAMAGLRDSGECAALDEARLACAGSTTVEGQTVEVVAVIAADPAATSSDGTPLFMICESADDRLFCEASGVRGRIGFKTVIETRELPTIELMRSLYGRVDGAFDSWTPAP